MKPFLQPSQYIDFEHPDILKKSQQLAAGHIDKHDIIKSCFEFVRDHIKHSVDYQLDSITCKASDVLIHGTGYCYAKSHLLAALLRANGIPTGLCYQRLTLSDDQSPFCLHGLNAVWLENLHGKKSGWYRIDSRGNKEGINAQFSPPNEKLAFNITCEGEADLPEVWSEPLPNVVDVLTTYKTYLSVLNNLPDVELLT